MEKEAEDKARLAGLAEDALGVVDRPVGDRNRQ